MAASDQDVTHSGDAGPGVLVREGSYGTQVFDGRARRGGIHSAQRTARPADPAVLDLDLAEHGVRHDLRRRARGRGVRPRLLGGRAGPRPRQRDRRRSPRGSCPLRGPKYGVPQMVLSRLGFGYWGNALPAGLNSVTAGIGWFAVNSVSGALRAERADPPAAGALPAHHRGGAGRGRVLRPQPGARVRAVRLPGARRHLPDRVRRSS